MSCIVSMSKIGAVCMSSRPPEKGIISELTLISRCFLIIFTRNLLQDVLIMDFD